MVNNLGRWYEAVFSFIINMKNPNIIVVVCLFDRFENLRRWIHAWNSCEQMEAKLFIINNEFCGIDTAFWEDYCRVRGINYIQRDNTGFETGIIQDVITGKLLEEEEWDVLFFATDDTIPIQKDFLKMYVEEALKPDTGVACMEISGNYTPHIRTTGWCIRRDIAEVIEFKHTPITDKTHCYDFEHTGGDMTLMAQIIKMDKRVIQMANLDKSAIWDTHHTKLNRWEEWHKEFPNYND
jgi:hypothetical protein